MVERTRAGRLWGALAIFAATLIFAACTDTPSDGDTRNATGSAVSTAGEAASTTGPPQPVDISQTFETVKSGVVRVSASGCDVESIGTGFLVNPTTIVTAAHVVVGNNEVTIRSGTWSTPAVVAGLDAEQDLAVLTISEPLDLHVFELSASTPAAGTRVAAIGYPLGLDQSLAVGAISNTGTTPDDQGRSFVQSDVAINPGNSGGPLIAEDGAVVGMVNHTLRDTEGLAFAVRSADITDHLQNWSSGRLPAASECPTSPAPEFEAETPEASWAQESVPPTTDMAWLVEAIREFYPLPEDCGLLASTAMADLGWKFDELGPAVSRLGEHLQYGWTGADRSTGVYFFIWPNGNPNLERYFDADPDGQTFLDGSVRRSIDYEQHLLAIPGQACFYEIVLDDPCMACIGNFWDSLRFIDLS